MKRIGGERYLEAYFWIDQEQRFHQLNTGCPPKNSSTEFPSWPSMMLVNKFMGIEMSMIDISDERGLRGFRGLMC